MVTKFAGFVLVGSVAMGSLLGCQPNTDTVDSEAVTEEHAEPSQEEHVHHEHDGHDHDDHNGHDHDDHEGHDHASAGTPFVCEPTTTIRVSYNNDSTPQTASLLIDGLEYDLNARESTDKTVYMSDIGLDDTHGIIWQVDGDKATLRNKTLDGNVAIEEDVIFNCQKS